MKIRCRPIFAAPKATQPVVLWDRIVPLMRSLCKHTVLLASSRRTVPAGCQTCWSRCSCWSRCWSTSTHLFFSWLLADCLLAGSLDLPLVPGKATRLSSYRSLMPLEISSLVKTMALSLEILPVCFFSGREGNMSAIRLAINPAVTSGCSSTIRRHCGCPFPLNLFA